MSKQTVEIIKELVISILFVASIGIIFAIIFYDNIAIGKVIPQAEEYSITEEMQNELENTKLNDAEEVIIDYYIDASDLKKYEKRNEYVKGKSNPFAEVDNIVTGNNTVTGENNNETSNSNTILNENEGF